MIPLRQHLVRARYPTNRPRCVPADALVFEELEQAIYVPHRSRMIADQ